MGRRLLRAAFAVLAISGGAFAQTTTRITLDGALSIALSDNYTLLAKRFELQSVRAGEITAALRPNPTANYNASNIGGVPGQFGDIDHSVGLQATIETAGKRERRIEFSKAATAVTGYELDDLRRLTTLQVKTAFIGVLAGRAKLTLAQENLKNLDEVERLQKLRAVKGEISELELLRIQGQRLGFESDAADAKLAVRTAKIMLRQVVSQERLAEDFDVYGDLQPRSPGSLDLSTLHKRALAARPDILAADQAADRSRADLRLAEAKAVPDLQPQVSYNDTHDNGQYASVGLSVALPIFDRNQGEIARAKADIERYARLADAARAQVIADVDAAVATCKIARDKYVLIRDKFLGKARTARDRLNSTYRKGESSLLDYLDAERTYRETAKAHIAALSDYLVALAQLDAATGAPVEP